MKISNPPGVHGELTGVGVDDHHTEDHAAEHDPDGGDTLAVDAAVDVGSLRTLGTGALQALPGDTVAVLQSQIISGSRTAAAGSGDQALTGVGFQPVAIIVLCTSSTDPINEGSWGFGDDDLDEALMFARATPIRSSGGGQIINVSADGSNGMAAVLKSLDADGLTLTWTKSGTPTGTAEFHILALR